MFTSSCLIIARNGEPSRASSAGIGIGLPNGGAARRYFDGWRKQTEMCADALRLIISSLLATQIGIIWETDCWNMTTGVGTGEPCDEKRQRDKSILKNPRNISCDARRWNRPKVKAMQKRQKAAAAKRRIRNLMGVKAQLISPHRQYQRR